MSRAVVLDTETTGLNPREGHRIIEIGCVELQQSVPTGRTFSCYLNPDRSVEAAAVAVHGLTDAFLADQPRFAERVGALLDFIADDPLIIHNAKFDIGFLNAELERVGFPTIPLSRAVDTLALATQKFPGAPASLDALCKRFAIDLSGRSLHGALLDARLLADVYVELTGGRQTRLAMTHRAHRPLSSDLPTLREPIIRAASPAEQAAHQQFLGQIPNALWLKQD